jgi:biotin transporter BioY
MKEKLCKLIDVKSLVTLTLTGVFAYMNITGLEVPETFKTIYVMIIGFYFGTQYEKRNK